MVTIIKKSVKKKDLNNLLKTSNTQKPGKLLDAKKYYGITKLDDDPEKIQSRLRNEWRQDIS